MGTKRTNQKVKGLLVDTDGLWNSGRADRLVRTRCDSENASVGRSCSLGLQIAGTK